MVTSNLPQRRFFDSNQTRSYEFRRQSLLRLKQAIKNQTPAILEALRKDLKKPDVESYLSEIAFVQKEIFYTLRHLKQWMKPRRVGTPWLQWIARSHVQTEPMGVVLIIGPWNYPFQLLLSPLVGALAAGNCAVLKPSELAPATAETVTRLIAETFDPAVVTSVPGDVQVSQALLEQQWDYIFFTGSVGVGRHIMAAASKYLTPVTLELGGKSPCIVDADTDIDASARRIVWGKFFNAGQTCVAPDYVLVSKKIRQDLVLRMQAYVETFFGKDPAQSPDYARIINARHFDRLCGILGEARVTTSRDSLYIPPTLLVGVGGDHPSMREEIFGPILPVIEYSDLSDAIRFVKERPKPLACYLFSKNKETQRRILSELSFGGGCVNDTLVHLSNPKLPFGGVGESGMGAYHGEYSYKTFSHQKSIMKRSFWIDPRFRYPPYKNRLGFFRKLIG